MNMHLTYMLCINNVPINWVPTAQFNHLGCLLDYHKPNSRDDILIRFLFFSIGIAINNVKAVDSAAHFKLPLGLTACPSTECPRIGMYM